MKTLELQSQLLVRRVREQRPLAECAAALCELLRGCSPVQAAWYLTWQADSGSYLPMCGGRLPPAADDPLTLNDEPLRAQLQQQARLSLAELRGVPCWLAGRLRRAGIELGLAQPLVLQPGQPGLLLLQLEEGGNQQALELALVLLRNLLATAGGQPSNTPWLDADPQPALLLDGNAELLGHNSAWQQLLAGQPAERFWPVNHAQLVRACLAQRRTIESVEANVGERILLWSYVPDPAEARVLARCRDASAEVRAGREGARARRLYRLITENTTDLISRHTLDGRFLDASPASWTLLGYWPEMLRGSPARALFHPQDLAQLVGRARSALEQDGYHTMTFRARHRDGYFLWFETACRAIRETYTGQVVEVVAVSRDITARVQAEENRRRLAEVVEVNTDLVMFVDAKGRLTYLNPAARRALGVVGEQLPALEALLGAEDLQRLRGEGRECAEQRGVWSGEVRLQPCEAGASLPVSLVLLAHRPATGERYYSLVARDMTERELREAQQRRHQDELAHTARLITLGELASGIAHEINQPLAAVVNYAGASQRYLQSLGSNPQAAERIAQGLARITEQANHASEVIRRLRAFLRKGQRRMQALNVAQVAREAVRLCAWEAAQAQVTVDERMDDNLPPAYADPVLLEQVLLNLLRNAIDANRERHAGAASHIMLSTALQHGELCVRVEDQGPGADAERLAQMFTPFFTSKPDGLGLGLSMSRSIIEGFGGALEARPGEQGGLCLECRLPLRDNHNETGNRP
ncbi:MAG TPA: PAS domain S-box protein [Pseudomonas sp.]|nr:PAS domain S-box protein [Pseudomonas sp.]